MLKNNFSQSLPQPVTQVELPLIPWTIYRDTDNEPQPITSKTPASAHIYLETSDLPSGVPRNNFTIGTNNIFFANVSRLSFVGAGIPNWYIPNVNPRNNTFTIYSGVTGLTHSVALASAYYDDPTLLADDIVTALNSISGATGLTFAHSAERSTHPRSYDLSVTAPVGQTYYFVNTCTAVTHGDTVYNLPVDQVPTNSKVIGSMPLKYTLYVDICSTTLTKYARVRTITSNSRSSILARTFMGGLDWGNTTYAASSVEGFSYAFRPAEPVTTVDIQLYDSHGELLYIPPELEDKLIFQLTIHVEL